MKAKYRGIFLKAFAGAMLAGGAGPAMGGVEGASSTFYGVSAGANAPASSGDNTFFGRSAGQFTQTANGSTYVGSYSGFNANAFGNTFVGFQSGAQLTTGTSNTLLGAIAGGSLVSGIGNVFLGYNAGYSEVGSNRLVIDNCYWWVVTPCDRPLVYGEFDNRRLHFDGVVGVTANRIAGTAKSQLHFSLNGADVGGWLTSAGDNNFFTSSGARFQAGNWIQRSADGKAVIAGSGGVGFRVLTSSGGAVGSAVVPVSRLHIDYNGLMGVNTAPVAGRAINTSTGAYLSSGGMWVNASSRELKQGIRKLSAADAQAAFEKLSPVLFEYLQEEGTHVGFIAEEVPELVATADRKGLGAMDVVAVLTKVVQQQAAELAEMKERLRRLESR